LKTVVVLFHRTTIALFSGTLTLSLYSSSKVYLYGYIVNGFVCGCC